MSVKTKLVWLNGKFIPFKKAQVPLLTHSLHYGSAVFEGIRCYDTRKGPAIFRLKDHIDRLFHSAAVLGMKITFTKKEIIKAIKETVKKNNLKECYIRPIVYYGEKMGLFPLGAPLHFAIAAWPWGKYLNKESVAVKVSSFIRLHPHSSIMTAKISGHYFNSILASLEAKKAGFDEALLLDSSGNIAEGPGENIFFIRNKSVITPQKRTILPGITRDSIITIAKDLGYRITEKNIKPTELKNFSEVFFTGTAVEINAIGRINNIEFNSGEEGKITKKIKNIYLKIVHGEIKKYEKWLDYIK